MDSATQQYQQAITEAALFNLSERGKVLAQGKDAESFLQNLCTNNLKDLQPNQTCEAFLTTAKARVVAQVFVSLLNQEQGPSYLIDTVPGMGETVIKHMDHFLISEQVELSDESQNLSLFHLCGPKAESCFEKIQSLPLVFLRDNRYLRLPGWDICCRAEEKDSILSAIGIPETDLEVYEILRVESGFPLFGKDIDENRLVMEAGRTDQAISYTKGCFLGQEPIVMARDRGHANRTLMGLAVADGKQIDSGSKVFHQGKEVGITTSCVDSPRFGTICLAYIHRSSQTPDLPVQIQTEENRFSATIHSLPFTPKP